MTTRYTISKSEFKGACCPWVVDAEHDMYFFKTWREAIDFCSPPSRTKEVA